MVKMTGLIEEEAKKLAGRWYCKCINESGFAKNIHYYDEKNKTAENETNK